jgi:hypothetical protein
LAIKGKGRTRGRRTVAAPPKRAIVVRKPPIWRRRRLWAAAGLVAVAGIAAAILSAMHSHDVAARKEREIKAVRGYLNQFQFHLPADRTPIPPDAIVIFSSVQDDIDNFKDLSRAQAEKKGKDVTDAATKSSGGLEKVRIAGLIPEEFATDRAELGEAQFLIVQAYRLYEPVGALFQQAAGVSGEARQALLDQAQSLMNQSGALFDRGYVKIVRMANRLGIPIKTAFQPAPNTPGGNVSPTPAPSATPSASASPSASPSA